ncbi:MAG: HD domain-containing protein [Flavobacteriales bacterium]|nr:HD domain-containing protein [Flavobacteriales bacterium]
MDKDTLIEKVRAHVIAKFENESSGHDHFHIQRVVNLSKHIAEKEGADVWSCLMIAWLHELDDYKLTDGDGNCVKLLTELGMEEDETLRFAAACHQISFKGNNVNTIPKTLEAKVVQDADRLDAIGAIGVARTFAYGGKKGQSIYHPDIKPKEHHTFEEYKKGKTTTVNHFYEKLLLLKDLMNTEEGKRIAEERHAFLQTYLDKFLREWNSVDI